MAVQYTGKKFDLTNDTEILQSNSSKWEKEQKKT